VPTLVRREDFATAAALNQTIYMVGFVVGPSVAGLVISRLSLSAAFWIDVVTFGAALLCIVRLPALVPHGGGTKPGFRSVVEGFRYVGGQRAVLGAFAIDINAMVFGMPRALFPEIGTQVYGGGPGTVGLLYAAPGAGALIGALTTGWVRNVKGAGRAVEIAVVLWGLAIAGFGLATWLPLGLLFLAIAGAADVISAVFRNTIVQLTVPDELRGRVNALNIAVVTGGPRLGDLESGAVSAATTPRFSVVSGGILCVAGVGVLARLLPELRRWRLPTGSVEPP
jgi:predicted MFS family arabinose efflux permease